MIGTAVRLSLVALGTASLACAHPGTVADDAGEVPVVSHDRSVLSPSDLHAASDQYLYDVIQRLRPEWLFVHGSTSIASGVGGNVEPDPIRVYVGMVRLGGPEVLTRLPTAHADSLKFFTPAQAQLRFGPGNTNGVIQILTAPPPPPP